MQLRPVETAGVDAGEVTALEPLTGLVAGQQVTVSYAVPPPPADTGGDQEQTDEQSAEQRGRGQGNGQGNGRGRD